VFTLGWFHKVNIDQAVDVAEPDEQRERQRMNVAEAEQYYCGDVWDIPQRQFAVVPLDVVNCIFVRRGTFWANFVDGDANELTLMQS